MSATAWWWMLSALAASIIVWCALVLAYVVEAIHIVIDHLRIVRQQRRIRRSQWP